MPATETRAMQRAVSTWYAENGHDFPWRETHDPYAILISEVMLQQTQVSRVLPRYREWLDRWPTVEALAAASPGDVIRAWDGMGYNRRAINLHRCAVAIAELGSFPETPAELEQLPGIGPYTAAAIACFAFGAQLAAPDTNARRVLGRAFGDPDLPPPPGGAYEWNQALFDLGREICIARRPRCERCPLAEGCPSRGTVYEPLRRQSRFEGSFRQRRARVLKAVSAEHTLPLDELDLEAAEALAADGLVEIRDGQVSLPGYVDEHTRPRSTSQGVTR